MANDTMTKVIASFRDDPKFMQDHVSPRTQARRDVTTEVAGALQNDYTQEFLARLAKLSGTE
jgi:hypothetical protein